MLNLNDRIRLERTITTTLVRHLLEKGCWLKMSDDYETWSIDNDNVSDVWAGDEAMIRVFLPGTPIVKSFVYLVYGNDGYDLIADHGVSLDDLMEPIDRWVRDMEAAEDAGIPMPPFDPKNYA